MQAVENAPNQEEAQTALREFNSHQDSIPDILGNKDNTSPRGKVLVQYRPAHGCDDKALWRVWAEEGGSRTAGILGSR